MHKLVCYSLENVNSTNRRKLYRKLNGYKDGSNYGKYKYQRKGLIQTIECRKIIDSAILLCEENALKLIKLLKKHKAKVFVFSVKED